MTDHNYPAGLAGQSLGGLADVRLGAAQYLVDLVKYRAERVSGRQLYKGSPGLPSHHAEVSDNFPDGVW